MTFSYPFVETRTREGWETWDRFGVRVDANGRLVLASDPVPAYEPPVSLTDDSAALDVEDVAPDECGNLAFLSTSGEVFRYDVGKRTATRVACLSGDGDEDAEGDADGDSFAVPRALSFAADTLYVAHGPGGDVRIHAFSRHLLQRRWTVRSPFDDPVALVERGGLLHVLDRGVPQTGSADGEETTGGFVASLDEDGRVEVLHRELGDVVDFATDGRGWLYVLARTDSGGDDASEGPRYAVYAFDDRDADAGDEWTTVPPEAFPRDGDAGLELSCLGASLDGSLYVGVAAAPEDGGGVYRLAVSNAAGGGDGDGEGNGEHGDPAGGGDAETGASFVRLPTVRLGCAGLLLEERHRRPNSGRDAAQSSSDAAAAATDRRVEGRLYLVSPTADETTRETANRVFSLTRTTRYLPSRGGPARFVGRAVKRFDSGEAETVWHRVQTEIPESGPGTRVRLRYFAVDAPARTGSTDGEGDGVEGSGAEPFDPEGFERIPDLTAEAAQRLAAANVLGVAGLAELGVDEVLDVLEPESKPPLSRSVSRATVRAWLDAANRLASQWTRLAATPPSDALLDARTSTGRTLWVELELLGDEFATPAVESVRAYFPRQSYLRYLPSIYREDAASAEFLTRFLSLFESTYAGVEAEFEGLTRYFDVEGVPETNLGWLADWVGVSLDETWSEATRRTILGRATELSKMRGTRRGVTNLLDIVLDDVGEWSVSWDAARERERRSLEALAEEGFVDDVEEALSKHADLSDEYDPFTTKRVHLWEFDDFGCVDTPGAKAAFREVLRCPQCFVVLVRAAATDEQWRSVRRLVAGETPAHAVGSVVELRSRLEVGGHTYLGVNSVVSDGQFVVESSGLGRDSTLDEREPRGQLDVGATVGTDTRLS